ncbi:Taurine catabolism dioxygenase TauD/TfdA [Cordyceps fumosorosea ARSEF 2679]|uniref:Taurine catabolism dioxygenase TauD/TfdA n=1 Tax=Cordyceps fumosorosea (strain ARSEF 2679) TaxID=1081104 RepID=A0A167NJS4_CORFA|nr:Taurine catabolism dioxygenase TauD/TfdA [Cordyceps fumosorosea ARSEF 2679]OAA55624.1 Taurine catabolism dioxygenase TauD/TfdA [Cordyceps fumosorosea ARSEF 2679]
MESLATTLLRPGRIICRSHITPHLRLPVLRPPAPRPLHSATGPLPSLTLPTLLAPHLSCSQQAEHVAQVAAHLEADGILKITLRFPDAASAYLAALVRSLHAHHGHRLPVAHSATRGWFWDVQPDPQTVGGGGGGLARSETMEAFPWHTDCSYEHPPPRFFALHVLRADRRGGGALSVMSAARLLRGLDDATRGALARPDFRIAVPPEFAKDPALTSIRGSLISSSSSSEDPGPPLIRFREDIVTPLGDEAAEALARLREALRREAEAAAMRLSAEELPAGSVLVMDNRRWLHARNAVADPERHLRRVRWDAVPFLGNESLERDAARADTGEKKGVA